MWLNASLANSLIVGGRVQQAGGGALRDERHQRALYRILFRVQWARVQVRHNGRPVWHAQHELVGQVLPYHLLRLMDDCAQCGVSE